MEIIENLIPHLRALWLPLKSYGWLLGIILILVGAYNLGNARGSGGYGGGRATALGWPSLICGWFLTSLTSAMDTFSWTAFREGAPSALNYVPPNANSVEGLLIQFGVYVLALVGLWGFIKGFSILANRANSQYSIGQGFTHILGGIFAMNFVTFAHVLGFSLGDSFNSVILRFIG